MLSIQCVARRRWWRKIQTIFAEKGDTQKAPLVRQFAEAYLAIPKHKLEHTWNHGHPLLNRLLFAKLESLPKRLFEKMVVRFTSDDYLLLVKHHKLLRIHELNDMRRRPIDLMARLMALGENSVHNAFHYEVIAFAKSIEDTKLVAFFKQRLAAIEQLMAGDEVLGIE
jgi:hypothetical protein